MKNDCGCAVSVSDRQPSVQQLYEPQLSIRPLSFHSRSFIFTACLQKDSHIFKKAHLVPAFFFSLFLHISFLDQSIWKLTKKL